jgi:hypothetical protein
MVLLKNKSSGDQDMIRIKTSTDVFEVSKDEAQGWAEMLDADGIAYTWEDLEDPPAPVVAPASFPAIGWVEERDRAYRPSKAEIAAQQAADRAAAVAAAEARHAAAAEEEDVPAWVIKAREQLSVNGGKGWGPIPPSIHRRRDGSWYMYDSIGARKDLPSSAGKYFTAMT